MHAYCVLLYFREAAHENCPAQTLFTALPDSVKKILLRVDGSEIGKSSHHCHVFIAESTRISHWSEQYTHTLAVSLARMVRRPCSSTEMYDLSTVAISNVSHRFEWLVRG